MFAQLPTAVTLAEAVTDSTAALVDTVFQAAKGGHWSLALGAGILLAVTFLRKFARLDERMPKAWLPWVAVVVGVAANAGMALFNGVALDASVLTAGVLTGVSAIGLWELVVKHFKKG